MAERDERQQEREERRDRRIQEQRVAQGRERREIRFFRRRERPPPRKKAVPREGFAETRARQIMSPPMNSDLDPGDPMSETIWRQVGPAIYTPPKKAPEGTVDPVDQVVTGITRVMWQRAERIRPGSKPLSYEEQRYRRVKRDIPSLPLALKRAELGGLNIGIGAIEGFTFPARPSAWVRTGEGLVGLATDKERRREAVEFAKARPEAVGLQLLGGVGGGYAAGKVIGKIHGEYVRRKYLTDLPEEAFLHPDEVRMGSYPEPVDVERMAVIGKESARVVDDLGAGFLDSHQVTKGTLPPPGTGLKTLDLRMGKAAISNWQEFAKGYYRTGHDLIPGLVPKGMGKIKTVYRFGLEYGTSFRPAVRFDMRPSFTPRSLTGLGLVGLSGIHGRPIETIKSDMVEKQVNRQIQRVGLGQRQRGREREMFATDKLLVERQKTIITPTVGKLPGFMPPPTIITPIEIQKQRQRQRAITLPDLKLEPKQTQQLKQAMAIPQIQRFSYREPSLEPVFSRRRKKKGRRGDLDLFTFGEIRKYPVKGVAEIMKDFMPEKRRRRKRKK